MDARQYLAQLPLPAFIAEVWPHADRIATTSGIAGQAERPQVRVAWCNATYSSLAEGPVAASGDGCVDGKLSGTAEGAVESDDNNTGGFLRGLRWLLDRPRSLSINGSGTINGLGDAAATGNAPSSTSQAASWVLDPFLEIPYEWCAIEIHSGDDSNDVDDGRGRRRRFAVQGRLLEWSPETPSKEEEELEAVGGENGADGSGSEVSANTAVYRRYMHVLDLCPTALAVTDLQGDPLVCNDKYLSFLGFTRAEFSALIKRRRQGDKKSLNRLVHPDDRDRVYNAWVECLKNEREMSIEYRYEQKDGGWLWVHHQTAIDKDQDGAPVAIMHSLTDVTTVKVLEQEKTESLRRRAEEAEEEKKQQNTFVDMVCHEIRNPLNGVLNNSAFLMESLESLENWIDSRVGGVDDEVAPILESLNEAVFSIKTCADHQKIIADEMLSMSKLNMNLITISSTPFDPAELVRAVLRTFKVELEAKQMTCTVEVLPGLEALRRREDDGGGGDNCRVAGGRQGFLGDPARISQVIINLVSNAIKFTQKSETRSLNVSVDVEPIDPTSPPPTGGETQAPLMDADGLPAMTHRLHVSVRDSGIGMTPEEKAVLFRQFSQANPKTYAKYGGSGLGLFLSKKLIELMGGEIDVESVKGEGCTFKFFVLIRARPSPGPAEKEERKAPLRKPPEPVGAGTVNLGDKKILIVDDNEINRKVLSRHLNHLDIPHSLATNGREAVETILSHYSSYALILLDLEMPILDGREAAIEIREWERTRGIGADGGRGGGGVDGGGFGGLPIIAVTGNARQEQVEVALKAGMQDVLLKPFTRQGLTNIILQHVSEKDED
ncbi:hypothetical protein HK101_003901 [Irineochytrium annulatum]|nr:hypothetical protein HK101_003901 [Irineochytrium annulatum]